MATRLCPLLLFVAACGGGGPKQPDAGPDPDAPRTPDGAPDGQPDAGPGIVTVHVTDEIGGPDQGAPLEGMTIAALDPGATTPALYVTDATGTATFVISPHATIWVKAETVYLKNLYLILDVSPGATIELGKPVPVTPSVAGALAVDFTPLPGHVFGFDHDDSFCSDGGVETSPGHILFESTPGCDAPPRELVITAYDETTFAPAAYLRVPGVSAAVTGTIDATALTWDTAGATYTATYAGLPGAIYSSIIWVMSDASSHIPAINVPIDGGAGAATFVDATHPTPWLVMSTLYHVNTTYQHVADPAPTAAADLGVDPATLLPFISPPNYDAASRTLGWSALATGPVEPQLVTAGFGYYDPMTDTHFLWWIYAPGTTTSLVIPDVPDELTAYDLRPDAFLYAHVVTAYVEGASYTDLLTDIDFDVEDLGFTTYRPTVRSRFEVAY